MVEFTTEYEARRACEDGADATAAQGTDRWFEAYGATADRLKDKRRIGGLLHSSLRSLVLNKVATRKGRVAVEPMMLGEARRACEAAADASAAPGTDDWFEAYGANAERLRDKWQVEPTVHHNLLSLARKKIATRDGQVVVPDATEDEPKDAPSP